MNALPLINLGAVPRPSLGAAARPCPNCGGVSHRSVMGQKQPPPPGVCCQLDPAGNTVCSDGNIYPPG